MTAGVSFALAGSADAASVALGRWSGGGPQGSVKFVVSRVRGGLVFSDAVVTCPGSAGATGDDSEGPGGITAPNLGGADSVSRHEAPIASDGRIYFGAGPGTREYGSSDLGDHPTGRLKGRSGTVTLGGQAGSGLTGNGCPDAALRDVHVSPDGARELADGVYALSGPLGTSGIFWVFGEGALIQFNASFATPEGGTEDDPDLCAQSPAAAIFGALGLPDPTQVILPNGGGAFLLDTVDDSGFVGQVSLAGSFASSASAVGDYSATLDLVGTGECSGSGPIALTLAHPAPALIPAPLPDENRHPDRHRNRHRLRTVRYVALGDSYSSGEGVAPYRPGSDTRTDRCHRSTRAYPQLLTLPGIRLKRSFYACSGATTKDILDESRFGEPPQLTHPSLRHARLITLTIGGNDAGFGYGLARCLRAAPGRCYRGKTARTIDARIDRLATSLVATYAAIRRLAPRRARIVALDYPDVFPAPGQRRCGKLRILYSARSTAFLHAAGDRLDDVMQAAARRTGVQFLDVRSAFAGHQVCAAREWIDFIVRGRHIRPSIGSFHPNAAGQAAYARVLRQALSRTR